MGSNIRIILNRKYGNNKRYTASGVECPDYCISCSLGSSSMNGMLNKHRISSTLCVQISSEFVAVNEHTCGNFGSSVGVPGLIVGDCFVGVGFRELCARISGERDLRIVQNTDRVLISFRYLLTSKTFTFEGMRNTIVCNTLGDILLFMWETILRKEKYVLCKWCSLHTLHPVMSYHGVISWVPIISLVKISGPFHRYYSPFHP